MFSMLYHKNKDNSIQLRSIYGPFELCDIREVITDHIYNNFITHYKIKTHSLPENPKQLKSKFINKTNRLIAVELYNVDICSIFFNLNVHDISP